MSKIIQINNTGTGFEEVLDETERLARRNGLDRRGQSRLRLLSEETMEMVRNISGKFEADVSVEINKGRFTLRMSSMGSMDSEDRMKLRDVVSKDDHTREVTGKIRAILESRYYDDSEQNREIFEQMGIQRLSPEDEAIAGDQAGEAYVWSLQSYGYKAFDRQLDEEQEDADWAEIGRSIIANLSDDLRIYIFRDHLELIVTRLVKADAEESAKWKIDPQLEMLKKVPVPSSRIQIRMVQLLYGGLMKKERSDERISVRQINLPCQTAPGHSLNCIVYEEKGRDVLPAVLLLHGGAFVLPALPYHYRLARHLAKNTGARVFMPFYDLAPKHKPPVQQDEGFEIYRFLTEHTEEYGIDPERIVIVGDSAGGTMCAALCLKARRQHVPMPAGQVLLYPSLDARLDSRSMRMYTDVPIVNAKAVDKYYQLCEYVHDMRNVEWASPVEADSLKGMPPTYVETAEYDCLHDDGILYANRLSRAHCDVVLNETKGTVHAYDMAKDSDVLKDSMERRVKFINDLFNS